jgi:hypothetical protein
MPCQYTYQQRLPAVCSARFPWSMTTFSPRPTGLPARGRRATLAALASVLLILSTACSADSQQSAPSASVPVAPPAGAWVEGQGMRLVVRFDDQLVGVRLDASPLVQQLVAALPLDVTLTDPLGQAKTGRLPQPLDVEGAERVDDPETGSLYYSPHGMIAFFYDDFGQAVPDPGLVRLGAVDSGLEVLADAGNRIAVHLELAP